MTFRDVLSVMLRRWYIPLAFIACAMFATVVLARDGGGYTTTTVVTFTRPDRSSLSTNGTNDVSVLAFAGTVVQVINNGRPPPRYSLSDAPFYGAGVREGVLVELANEGNQWVSNFTRSDVEIRIVGRSIDWVETRQRQLVAQVTSLVDSQQAAVDTTPTNRIRAAVVPLTMRIEQVTASRTSRLAGGGAMFAAALTVGAWGAVTADRLLLTRRSGTSPTTSPVSSDRQDGATS